jgi:AraC-like DNA-binding protein
MAISQIAAQVILDGLTRVGLDAATMARRAGLPLPLPPTVDERALEAVWLEARRRTQRASIALEVGLRTPEASFGLIYYLASSAATLGAGMTLLQRCLPLAMSWLRLSIDERDDEVVVAFARGPQFAGRDALDLFTLGLLLRRMQDVPVRPVHPRRIELPLRAPADERPWHQLLDGVPFSFAADQLRMTLGRADWALPLRRADARLVELLRRQLALTDGPHDALMAALRSLLRERLDQLPDVVEAARALGLSARSLQRKLGTTGTTFERELGQVRREVAESLLAQSHVSLGEVATRVGFAEQASFTRAFQRWTGTTPSRARRRLLPAPDLSR